MKKCEKCEFNNNGKCLKNFIIKVENRKETIIYKDIKELKECKHAK